MTLLQGWLFYLALAFLVAASIQWGWPLLVRGMAWVMSLADDKDEPIHPQRLRLVQKAQRELAEQAKWSRR